MPERLTPDQLAVIRQNLARSLPHTDENFALREWELERALSHIDAITAELRERTAHVVRLAGTVTLLQADIARLNEECERLRRNQVPDGDKPQPRDPYKYVNDYTEGPDGTFIRAERPKGE